ncbi:MAG: hypothetical protein KDD69_13745 [Bdellovibrionales bacterium]|nr:hypothetical protein [Bdellovibrionales bacterium]
MRSIVRALRSIAELDSRGTAVTEFAIIAPVLFLISIAGFEFSRTFKYLEVAKMLSRETSSIAFRMCSGETDAQKANRCLESVRQDLEGFGRNLFEGTVVLVSLYRYRGEYGGCDGTIDRIAVAGAELRPSAIRFIESDATEEREPGELNRRVVCDNRVVIVSEVFIPYTTILTMLLPGIEQAGGFYDVAIM